jgi:hypothetical protein
MLGTSATYLLLPSTYYHVRSTVCMDYTLDMPTCLLSIYGESLHGES